MNEQWQARVVERYDMMNRYAVYLRQRVGKRTVFLLENGTLEAFEDGSVPEEDPYFALFSQEQLQALTEALTNAGIKTRPIHQLEGQLDAQNKHLEDMRKLVFKGRKI